MIRFIVVEDKKEYRERFVNIINKVMMPYNFEYKINKFAEYNKELEEVIEKKNEQKIYILDIELPEVSGLEIASEIRTDDIDSTIIFITSHPEFQNDIFYSRLLAIDYINKDRIWPDRFEKTIIYTLRNLDKRRILAFEFNHNSYRIPIKDILYIEKVQDNQKCTINLENGSKYEIVSTIIEMKEKLGPSFFQSHKSCLINVEKIKKVNYNENTITFTNNETLYLLSNRNKKGLREYVAKY